ncbi:MAG: hypothetical protein H0V68_05755 [Actinobacteria bacterium]|nr:hypothetical protein [Actinomycetota bacterium]
MSLDVFQRVLVLAAAALVAGLGAVALAGGVRENEAREAAPRSVPAGDGGWYSALAGSRGAPGERERTTCRLILTNRSLGVTHPVLPCGAKIVVSYRDVELLTEVLDTRLKRPGRQFELTEALAQRLGVEGTQQIRWRFAAR